ncbi:hypothetical protein SAMN02745132_02907 [Enterovibrio nigricans DSM 22720]|uniref:Uncharacterized protein n=1 Tax=Enterovibrio nigricans DSM 22720 TaxID=1121868 RepID=A0A1T4V060_9GAMM|nr:hypothetical protein SAMN02745132_02907 [Enterovibrio nigricans DSM 22720]
MGSGTFSNWKRTSYSGLLSNPITKNGLFYTGGGDELVPIYGDVALGTELN